MVDIEKLKEKIDDIGMKVTVLSERSDINRVTFYNRLQGKGEFTAGEIARLTQTLNLTKKERDDIFFAKEVVSDTTRQEEA